MVASTVYAAEPLEVSVFRAAPVVAADQTQATVTVARVLPVKAIPEVRVSAAQLRTVAPVVAAAEPVLLVRTHQARLPEPVGMVLLVLSPDQV